MGKWNNGTKHLCKESSLFYKWSSSTVQVIHLNTPYAHDFKQRLILGQSSAQRVQICAFRLFRHRLTSMMAILKGQNTFGNYFKNTNDHKNVLV